jgi:hypothetical protein
MMSACLIFAAGLLTATEEEDFLIQEMDKRPPDPIRHTMIRLPYKQEYMDEIM